MLLLFFFVLFVSTQLTSSMVFDESSCGGTFQDVGLLELNADIVCPDNGQVQIPAVTLVGATTFDLMGHELSISNQREVVFATGVGTVIRNGSLRGAGVNPDVLPGILFWSASDGLVEDLTLQSSAMGIIVSDNFAGRDTARNTTFRNLAISDTLDDALDVRGENCTFVNIQTSDSERWAITVTGNQHIFQDVTVSNSVLVEGDDIDMRDFMITQFSGTGLEISVRHLCLRQGEFHAYPDENLFL